MLRAAVALADEAGLDAVNMRRLSEDLCVVPMALYKHVANKDELLGGPVDVLVGEIEPPMEAPTGRPPYGSGCSPADEHSCGPWARRVMESRTVPTPVVLGYVDSTIGMFRAGGLSVDLTHHVMHAMGSRLFGFTRLTTRGPSSVQAATTASTGIIPQPYVTAAEAASSSALSSSGTVTK